MEIGFNMVYMVLMTIVDRAQLRGGLGGCSHGPDIIWGPRAQVSGPC